MTFPTLDLDVAFTTDPLSAPSWTAVESYLYRFETVVGRQQALDTMQPGVAAFELDNSARRFDPEYPAGAYYGNLLPNKQTRLQATYGGTTYELFTGFADGFPQDYMPPNDARMTLRATDGFKVLARTTLPESPYAIEVKADAPQAWWRLGETTGDLMVDSSGNSFDGHYVSNPGASSVASLIAGSSNRAQEVVACTAIGTVPDASVITGTTYSIEFWVVMPNDSTVLALPYCQGKTDDGTFPFTYVSVTYNSVTFQTVGDSAFGTSKTSATGRNELHDGQPHHIVATCAGTSSSDMKIRIDGVVRNGAVTGNPVAVVAEPGFVGYTFDNAPNVETYTVDEVAIYPTALSGTRVNVHYDAGTEARTGETSGDRVDWVLDQSNWPTGARTLDAGESVLGEAQWSLGKKALAYLQQIERTEQGAFYVDHSNAGKLKFRARTSLLTATASTVSQATYSDDPGATLHYESLDFVRDEQLIINEVVVNWDDGSIVVRDEASIDTYTLHSVTVDSVCRLATEATNLGQWILGHYAETFARVRGMTFAPSSLNGATQDAVYAQCLGRKLGDRVTIVRTPQNLGAAISIDMLIEGIAHRVDPGVGSWVTTFWLSQAPTRAYWRLGTSLLGTSTRLGY